MPTPTVITDLDPVVANNFPAGSNAPSVLDDVQRAHAAFIAQLRDGKGFSTVATLASATTTDIGAQSSLAVEITGTTTITGFGTAYNGPRFLRFTGALLLTHNATTLNLPGAANITTVAGDTCMAYPNSTGNGWNVAAYQRSARTDALADIGGAPRATRIDIASVAGTVDLTANAPNTDDIRITGDLAITAFTVAVGRVVRFTASGVATLTNNASIVTNTGANVILRAGDTGVLRATAANVVEVLFLTRAAQQYELVFQNSTAYGSDASSKNKLYTNMEVNQGGVAMTATNSAAEGSYVTINIAGKYESGMVTTGGSTTIAAGISVNADGTDRTTAIGSIAAAKRIALGSGPVSNYATAVRTHYYAAGDVIRPHTDGQAAQTASIEKFWVIKVDA